MTGCRRIYNNLLLLSVIFFSLGSVAHPLLHSGCAAGLWQARCGTHDLPAASFLGAAECFLVYPPHHLCGPLCADQGMIAPEAEPVLPLRKNAPVYETPAVNKLPARPCGRSVSRAPPAV